MTSIDDINWDDLEHAYGRATDVPDVLAGLASDDVAARNNALYALYGSLLHQGTLYEATVAATPFLVEIALSDPRPEVVGYIADLVRGARFLDEPTDLDPPRFMDVEEFAARVENQRGLQREVANIVSERADEFVALLRDDDEQLAFMAACVLRGLGDERAAERILARAETAEEMVPLFLLAAVGLVDDWDTLAFEAADHVAATITGVGRWDAGAEIDISDLVSNPGLLEQTEEISREVGGLIDGLATVLARQPERLTPYRAELCDALGRLGEAAQPIAIALIEGTGADEQLLEQRDLLRAIAACDGAWAVNAYLLEDALAARGLDGVWNAEALWNVLGERPQELDEICQGQGWERVEVKVEDAAAPSGPVASNDPGLAWEAIDADQRSMLGTFVDRLGDAGWQETRPWHQNLQACGWAVSPQGVGRFFGEDATLEVAYWLYDQLHASETGEHHGDPYVQLTIGHDDRVSLPLRFYGPLDGVLDVLIEHQRDLTPDNYAEKFLRDMFQVADRVLAEANGGLLELSRDSE